MNVKHIASNVTFGFTRLAINGLTDDGMQPFYDGAISWICNGEIYNANKLASDLNVTLKSDCSVLGALYMKHRDDLATFARCLDGVFAIALYDAERKKVIVARDPYGVRPLYMASRVSPQQTILQPQYGQPIALYKPKMDTLVFASELKALCPYYDCPLAFSPGTVQTYDAVTLTLEQSIEYHTVPWIMNPSFSSREFGNKFQQPAEHIRYALEEAVSKRMLTERPCAALLSGGLDSSLIAALVQRNLQQLGRPWLKTFSIGFEGSQDLAHARLVADWIRSDHTEIVMTPDEFFNAIPEVIKAIESYDTTTVRASVGNYLIAKKIRELTDCKVVFNGDGSDEVFGGYLYFNNAPSAAEFQAETARLLKDIHMYDVLRSDRSISANGLEARTPFLDKQFVSVVRSVDPELLMPIPGEQVEKFLLRYAFDDGITLPSKVLWRRKEAFSDGVSSPEKAWYQEIQERVLKVVPMDWKEKAVLSYSDHLCPQTPEEYYYRSLFTYTYGKQATYVNNPYRWMPRWCPGATDPSARTLGVYAQKNESEVDE
jgi:asparagine synthase (glutamine-hydrolysing)